MTGSWAGTRFRCRRTCRSRRGRRSAGARCRLRPGRARPRSWSTGRAAVAAVDPSEPFVGRPVHASGRRRPAGVGRAAAVRGPFDAPWRSSSSTSWRIRRGHGGDEARDPRRGVVAACVWDHGGQGPLSRFWARRRGSTPRSRTSRCSRALVRASSRSCSTMRAAESRGDACRAASNTRASRSGGSRSHSASDLPASTSRGSDPTDRCVCGNCVENDCRQRG